MSIKTKNNFFFLKKQQQKKKTKKTDTLHLNFLLFTACSSQHGEEWRSLNMFSINSLWHKSSVLLNVSSKASLVAASNISPSCDLNKNHAAEYCGSSKWFKIPKRCHISQQHVPFVDFKKKALRGDTTRNNVFLCTSGEKTPKTHI